MRALRIVNYLWRHILPRYRLVSVISDSQHKPKVRERSLIGIKPFKHRISVGYYFGNFSFGISLLFFLFLQTLLDLVVISDFWQRLLLKTNGYVQKSFWSIFSRLSTSCVVHFVLFIFCPFSWLAYFHRNFDQLSLIIYLCNGSHFKPIVSILFYFYHSAI